MTLYKKDGITVESLVNVMKTNLAEAREIIKFINETDKNLYNSRDVIDWQDGLNEVSVTFVENN